MAAAEQLERVAIAMPNPEREVNRVVSHLLREGWTELNACVAVMNAASHAKYILAQVDITDTPWLDQLREFAHSRVRSRRSEVGITGGTAERNRDAQF
jgi:hypothetical protein